MITLYGTPASRTFRCLWMLKELGLEYEHVPTNFAGENKQPDYLALNPNGRIPTLVDGDTASQASNGWEKLLPSDEERDDLIEGVAILGEN